MEPLKTGFMPTKFSSNPSGALPRPTNSFPPDLDRVSFAFGYEKPGYKASNDQYLLAAQTDFATTKISEEHDDSSSY